MTPLSSNSRMPAPQAGDAGAAPASGTILRLYTRLGVIELGHDGEPFVRYYNRTASGRHNLDEAGYYRWVGWMLKRGAKTVAVV